MEKCKLQYFKTNEIKNPENILGGNGGEVIIDKDKIKPPRPGNGM